MHTLEQLTTSLVSQEDKEEDDGVVVNKVQSEDSGFNDPFFSSTATVCESLHWLICNKNCTLCRFVANQRKTKNCLAWKEKLSRKRRC